jgi:hypothetical protein
LKGSEVKNLKEAVQWISVAICFLAFGAFAAYSLDEQIQNETPSAVMTANY